MIYTIDGNMARNDKRHAETCPLPYFAAPYGDHRGFPFIPLSDSTMEAGTFGTRDYEIAAMHDGVCLRLHGGYVSIHAGRTGNLMINEFVPVRGITVQFLAELAKQIAKTFHRALPIARLSYEQAEAAISLIKASRFADTEKIEAHAKVEAERSAHWERLFPKSQ